MRDLTLEQRVARLEAIEDIRWLKAEYCGYCDDGYPSDKLGPLFVDDAVWDGGQFGRYEGREAIENFFAGVSDETAFAAHLVLNEQIEVDGDGAFGKWRLIMSATVLAEGDKEDRWLLADYHDTYVKRDGRWMFQGVDLFVNFFAPHAGGWAELAARRP